MEKLKKHSYLLVLTLFFILFYIFTFAKFGSPLADTGREFFIPYAMADLKTVLYKDIMCIYGPLPYILNACFIKIFGASFALFYALGGLSGYLFLFVFYALLKMFFSKKTAFLISLLTLVVTVFTPSMFFNFIVPYSYSVPYSAIFGALALLFGVRFINRKSLKYLYLTAFFTSCAILSKFDFILLLIPLVFLIVKSKASLKAIFKTIISLITLPVALFALSLILGVRIADYSNSFQIILNMAKSPALIYFYKNFMGLCPNFGASITILSTVIIPLFLLALPLLPRLFMEKIKSERICCGISAALLLVAFVYLVNTELRAYYLFVYASLPVIVFFLYDFFKKSPAKNETKPDTDYIFVLLFTLCYCAKVLFFMLLFSYGAAYFPFIALSLALILKKYLSKYRVAARYCAVLSLFFTLLFGVFGFQYFVNKVNEPLNTPAGTMYQANSPADTETLIKEITKLTSSDDAILGLPEGLYFNFVLKRKYDIFATSFTPLDFEVYGEDFLISSVKHAAPKVIFFTPKTSSEYGKKYICKDYAKTFCAEILKGYTPYPAPFTADSKFKIFIRKNDVEK